MTAQKALGWLLSALFCTFFLVQTWTWLQWIFTSTPLPPHHQKGHYKGDSTMLYAYLVILVTLYLVGLVLAKMQTWAPSVYLVCRRWWDYQLFGATVGTAVSVVGLVLVHGVVLVSVSSGDTVFEQHRVISDRLAQLGTVDLGVALLWWWHPVWHRWFARLGLVALVYHGGFQWTKHYYRRPHETQWQDLGEQHGLDAAMRTALGTWWPLTVSSTYYWTGTIMALALVALAVGSHRLVREGWYALFRAIHGVAAVVFLVVGLVHHWIVAVAFVGAGGLWVANVVARAKKAERGNVLALVPVAEDVVKLQVSYQGADVAPGQYLPCSFSGSAWKDTWWSHPFSVSRIDPQRLTFYIKARGRLTRQLYEMAGDKEAWPSVQLGQPLGQVWAGLECPVVVLIAEGIGITPWLAVLQAAAASSSPATHSTYVIWTVRNTDLIAPLINETTTASIDWQIYVTGDYQMESQVESLAIPPTCSLSSPYSHGRPHYPTLMESIRSRHPTQDVAMGLCVHDDSLCANLARSKKFSHSQAVWHVYSERFDV